MTSSTNQAADYTPTTTSAWKSLEQQAEKAQHQNISGFFDQNPSRSSQMSVQCGEIFLDYSKNLVSDETWQALLELANQSPLEQHRAAMFSGEKVNTTEGRAVLHGALRAEIGDQRVASAAVESDQRVTLVKQQLVDVELVSEQIRSGQWLGSTGKAITDVVNIGIGGSDLGPKLACSALQEFAHPDIKLHFISNVDGAEILTTLKKLNPETTLVALASKTFTTHETLLNAKTARNWFAETLGLENAQSTRHFVGLTANRANALAYGIPADQILEFAEWVGGRYSLWSSIGLSIAISIGFEKFVEMLAGAREMDLHFQQAPLAENMPVIMALLGIWYSNFLDAQSTAVIPYCERLLLLPSYLQQLDMESNGKSTTLNGDSIDYQTGAILWGQTGTNGQHAFFQLLHQGTRMVPVDFIAAAVDNLSNEEHHRVLLGNMLAQASALMCGQDAPDGEPYRYYPGNKPSNTLLLDTLSPKNFGALIALYEHKVFVQGSIWNINSFDQWGVELGKKMANQLLASDNSGQAELDPSTTALFAHIKKCQE
ncbi:glucose-6-phosphate isomerase [Porticoccaceae bacterium]|jgi:glucose-6-phosphate isomerase|nr:glucose-6-phosphate isomerase [Porticoccaceae bacterium]MDC0588676.1 glucose-6-phosphate isomerase [Porticoccaceae bacterium]MDG1080225.1 glucose-6-phosphate isomerase [Porticoccaceae bacterium]MDG1082426.1 glucose-6-phosphate isomerase [Porticoccaceae bacterium]